MRISLAGGGTDLPAYYQQYGGVVLSSAINKYFYSVLCGRSDGKIQIISSDLRISETWTEVARKELHDSRLEISLAVLQHLGKEASLDVFLASEILPGTGLGSSASVCVNVLASLSQYLDQPMSKYQLAEPAFHIARHVLGKPVGKHDEYASAFGGLNLVHFHADESTAVEPVDQVGLIDQTRSGKAAAPVFYRSLAPLLDHFEVPGTLQLQPLRRRH